MKLYQEQSKGIIFVNVKPESEPIPSFSCIDFSTRAVLFIKLASVKDLGNSAELARY